MASIYSDCKVSLNTRLRLKYKFLNAPHIPISLHPPIDASEIESRTVCIPNVSTIEELSFSPLVAHRVVSSQFREVLSIISAVLRSCKLALSVLSIDSPSMKSFIQCKGIITLPTFLMFLQFILLYGTQDSSLWVKRHFRRCLQKLQNNENSPFLGHTSYQFQGPLGGKGYI